MDQMNTAARPTGPELDQALARAIRRLIAEAAESGEDGEESDPGAAAA